MTHALTEPTLGEGAQVAGALVALLSFLLQAVNGVGSRIALAFLVGCLLASRRSLSTNWPRDRGGGFEPPSPAMERVLTPDVQG